MNSVIETFKYHNISRSDRCRDVDLITQGLYHQYIEKNTFLVMGEAYIEKLDFTFRYLPPYSYHIWIFSEDNEVIDLAISSVHEREDCKVTDLEIKDLWQEFSDDLQSKISLLAENGVNYTPYVVGDIAEIQKSLNEPIKNSNVYYGIDEEDSKELDRLMDTAEKLVKEKINNKE